MIPASIKDEEALLAEILDHASALKAVARVHLEPEHFYLDRHRAIYRAIRKAAASGTHPAEPTVWNALQSLDEGVSRESLLVLTGRSVNPFAVTGVAEIIIGLASERASLEGAHKVIEAVGANDPDEKAELMREGMELIAADYTTQAEPTSRQEIADDFFNYLDDTTQEDEVMALPWPGLNERVLGGYRRKQTTVLGGFTGMGKSWALDQMLTGFHAQGFRCGIFATEMSRRERVARFVTMKTGISTEKLIRKTLGQDDMKRAVVALEHVPFDYHECGGWTAEKICERIAFEGYDVAAIDVINLVPGYEERVEHASRIAGQFMQLAQRANCHIILVSHLNRERDKSNVKPRPVKRDLRQTGMLEANANAILFLHRDQTEEGVKEQTGELFFDKVRNGMEGRVLVEHDLRHLTFEERPVSTWMAA